MFWRSRHPIRMPADWSERPLSSLMHFLLCSMICSGVAPLGGGNHGLKSFSTDKPRVRKINKNKIITIDILIKIYNIIIYGIIIIKNNQ